MAVSKYQKKIDLDEGYDLRLESAREGRTIFRSWRCKISDERQSCKFRFAAVVFGIHAYV